MIGKLLNLGFLVALGAAIGWTLPQVGLRPGPSPDGAPANAVVPAPAATDETAAATAGRASREADPKPGEPELAEPELAEPDPTEPGPTDPGLAKGADASDGRGGPTPTGTAAAMPVSPLPPRPALAHDLTAEEASAAALFGAPPPPGAAGPRVGGVHRAPPAPPPAAPVDPERLRALQRGYLDLDARLATIGR